MALDKLDRQQASKLFSDQVTAQADAAKTVASLMKASLTDPSLAQVADSLAEQVFKAAEAALAQIKGVPLEPGAIQSGHKASDSIMEALRSMVSVRESYWENYKETQVPKNAAWIPAKELPNRLDSIAEFLVQRSKGGPAAAQVNSVQIMIALPGDDAKAVMDRHEGAKKLAEAGSYLGEMHALVRGQVAAAEGLQKISDATAKDPAGRSIQTILKDLDVRVRDKHGSTPPDGAYVAAAIQTLVHPAEIERLVKYAVKDLETNFGTSPLTFVGNMRYALAYEMNVSGTAPHWQAAMKAIERG